MSLLHARPARRLDARRRAFASGRRPPVRLEHLALWTRNAESLERLRAFYGEHFGATASARYASARRPGFLSVLPDLPAAARVSS
jgi:hypothetical protein